MLPIDQSHRPAHHSNYPTKGRPEQTPVRAQSENSHGQLSSAGGSSQFLDLLSGNKPAAKVSVLAGLELGGSHRGRA